MLTSVPKILVKDIKKIVPKKKDKKNSLKITFLYFKNIYYINFNVSLLY
jgi:hypothetical protein